MKTSNLLVSAMKPLSLLNLLLGAALLAMPLNSRAVAADLTQLIAAVAKHESGQNAECLWQLERIVRDSAGQRKQRAEVESALTQLLAPTATFEARRFACQQLAIIGSDASVPALAKLLRENETIGIACLAFGNRPSAKADRALRSAVSAARGSGRAQIIAALGNRRDAKAVSLLAKAARETETIVAQAALQALGKIGNRAAQKAIAGLQSKVTPGLALCLAEAELQIAEQLAAAGDRKTATQIYERYIAPNQTAALRRGAYTALARLDQDGGEARVLATLRGSDATLRPVAIGLVRSLPSPNASSNLVRALPDLPPHEQIWLIESLAARGDSPARAALVVSLGSTHATVRNAAAAALSRVGDFTAVHGLASAIAAAADADETRALVAALGAFPRRPETDRAIIGEIKAARGETRAQLINALASRPSAEVNAALLAEAENSEPAVARAAYRVLARTADGELLPKLVAKFAALRNGALRAEVAGFVEQAVAATEPATARSAAVLPALKAAPDVETSCALLALLPACADETSLAALKEISANSDAQQREAALRALAEWPTIAAWDSLAEIWNKADTEARRSLALRGLVRLADEANAKVDASLIAHYRELLAGARTDEERKLILGALGGAAHPDAMLLALSLREMPGIRVEAHAAVTRIANAIEKQHPEAAKAAREKLAK